LKPAAFLRIFPAVTLFGLAWASSLALAGESYFSLPFEKLLKLAVCAEMRTLGRDCGTMPGDFNERSKALEAGLEDLWALNYGEKNPRKLAEASRMIRNFTRFDLGVLVKNPAFAKAALLRAETGIKFLMEKQRNGGALMDIKGSKVLRMKDEEMVRTAEDLYAKEQFVEMRLQLYKALWLADPLTAVNPMPDPAQGQGMADNPLHPVIHS
jgi:hypothetical protein